MDEIEYKLNTKNSVLIVNAVDKLISTIKSKYKPADRQKFVLENEELKLLREKCSSEDAVVSLTACQGLLALVELGVLEIAHTMSTVVTLLPSAHNYSAIISTMAGLLILDLKSRIVPGQQYKCQFSLKTPQHPFITVLEKNKGADNYVLTQMHALCTHPDYIVSSNSLELLRPVFFWLTCNPQRDCSIRPWQLLLSLPQSTSQSSLLLACLSCQQICNPTLIEKAFAAYSAVSDTAIYQCHRTNVMALLPMLARISNELIRHGRDPRSCYNLIERCFALDAPELKTVAGITLMLLAENLTETSALYLHELYNLCLNIVSKYECSSLSLNVLIALSLQWLHLPSYLTSPALKMASKLLDTYQQSSNSNTRLHMPNLKANKIFQALLYTDSHLSIIFKMNQNWERIRDNKERLLNWLDYIGSVHDELKVELLPFLLGIAFEKSQELWFEDVVLKVLRIAISLVDFKKELSVQLLPILLYKIGNDKRPGVKWECLRALPLMAKTKENVPTIVSILNKLKANKGVPTSFLIMLYTSLAETQVRCFPYLQELLVDSTNRPDDLKWEVDVSRAVAVRRICEIRPSSHGLELVSVISSLLNRCGDKAGSAASATALHSLALLWHAHALAPHSTWSALQPKLGRDSRPVVQISLCKLLSEVPSLRVSSPEYDKLLSDTARKLWTLVAESNQPEVVEAACDALAAYKIEDYKLKDIPEIYRKTVRLPAAYCKTPADAARRPEDVLDYVPCEIWPEVFRYTNQAALSGVQSLVSKLLEREVKAYRSGIYQLEGRPEPSNLNHMPNTSIARGLLECFRKQATTPSYDFQEAVLLAILNTLTADHSKPLPPCEMYFLPELLHRGQSWRKGGITLAARQAHVSASARRIMDNFLDGIVNGSAEESDTTLVFEILPILCRVMPPNSLRGPLQKCLGESYAQVSHVKAKKAAEGEVYQFITQMVMMKQCLDCERIHDANRTLLCQIVEGFMAEMSDDNVAWPTYVQTCRSLSTVHLERMSSPSGWWEVTSELIRKACGLRCALAESTECSAPLVWLNEIVDAHATHITEQEFSLRCMMPALKKANPNAPATKEWFLQLMGRTQVAFNEMEDKSGKLYLCDVFMLSVIVFSGHWCLEPDTELQLIDRNGRHALLPAAAAALVSREPWADCTVQLLEWLSHTRTVLCDAAMALCCQRALLALRHTRDFTTHRIWTRLENHFGCDLIEE